jgi:serine/threonine protein kinase
LADALGRIHKFEYPVDTEGAVAGATAAALGLNGAAVEGEKGAADLAAASTKPALVRRQTRRRTRTHGFHGDLKPDNILRYCGWKIPPHALPGAYSQQPEDPSHLRRDTVASQRSTTASASGSGSNRGQRQAALDPLGVLQITDFGLSSFHHTETAADIKAKLLGHPYRPPESQLIMKTTQSLDTWTLGCLFLDFLTWLVEGPGGLDKFEDMRVSPGIVSSSEVYFYDLTEKDDWTTVSVSAGVLKVSALRPVVLIYS